MVLRNPVLKRFSLANSGEMPILRDFVEFSPTLEMFFGDLL